MRCQYNSWENIAWFCSVYWTLNESESELWMYIGTRQDCSKFEKSEKMAALLLRWISIRPWWTLELLTELKMIDLYSYIFRIYEDKLYFFSPVDCLKEKKEDGRGVDVKTFRLLYLFPTIGNVAFGDTFCCNLDIYGKYSRLGYKTSQNSVKT